MKVSKVIIIVVALHVLVIGGIFVFEGCSRTRVAGPEMAVDETTPGTLPSDTLPAVTDPLIAGTDGLVPAETGVPAVSATDVASTAPLSPAPAIAAATTHTVKKGDSLWKVSKTEGVGMTELLKANNITKTSTLKIGQVLTIPSKAIAAAPPAADATALTAATTVDAGSAPTVAAATTATTTTDSPAYTVKPGDSLWKIARANNTTVSAIKQANSLNSDIVKVGQQIRLPSAAVTATVSSAAPTPAPAVRAAIATPTYTSEWDEPGRNFTENGQQFHVVDFNESLGAIATKYNVSLQDLRTANKLNDVRNIHPGQRLAIPGTAAPATTTDATMAAPIVSAPVVN